MNPRIFRTEGGRWPLSWLGLVAGWPLLKRPHVAVWVTEVRVEDAAHVVDVAELDAALRQSGPGGCHVFHDEMEAFDRAWDHVGDRAHPGAEDDGAARPGRGELYYPHRFRDLGVVQIFEAGLLVERLRPVNVRYRKRDELQAHFRDGRGACH